MIEFKFIGGAYEARSTNLDAQVCQNLFPVIDGQGGKNVIALFGSPGLLQWSDPSHAAEVRAVYANETYLYAVIGNRAYRFDTAGTAVQMTGTITNSAGYASMSENYDDEILIVDEPDGYILDTTTNAVTAIAAVGFPSATNGIQQDGYFIVTKQNSADWQFSGLNAGTLWDILDIYQADSQPDFLLACISTGRDLWFLGNSTTEVWYNSGDPFARYQNVFFDKVGCGARGTPLVTPEGLVWLDNHFRVVCVPVGTYQVIPKSTFQIDYQIKQLTTKSDARAYWYQGEGHTFYVLTFPTEDKTFELNLTTGFFNTRASDADDHRHRGNCSAFFNGKWIVGDYENGKLYEIDYDTFTENSLAMRAIRRGQAVHQDRERLSHYELEIEFEAGIGLITGQGSDPQAMLRYSDDGGHTWSNERWKSIGKIGEYSKRVKWNRLGQSRSRIYEVVVSDPVKRNIINAYLSADAGKEPIPGMGT